MQKKTKPTACPWNINRKNSEKCDFVDI